MCVQVYKCLPTWEAHWGGWPRCSWQSPEYLAVRIWNRIPFEKIIISSLERSHQSGCASVPGLVSVPSTLGRAAYHTTARSQGRGAVVLAREVTVTSMAPGTSATTNGTESD